MQNLHNLTIFKIICLLVSKMTVVNHPKNKTKGYKQTIKNLFYDNKT